jgi:uncharacterized protein
MFWQIEGTNTSLLATVHVSDVTPLILPPGARGAVDSAARLIFETDPDEPNDLTALLLPAEVRFASLMTPAEFDGASASWWMLGLPPERMLTFVPFFVSISLEVTNAARAGYTQGLGLEHQLWARAKQNGTRLEYLERKTDLFRALASTPFSEQVVVLAEALNSGDLGLSKLKKMLAAWRSTDTEYFERFLADRVAQTPIGTALLITSRNQLWLPAIVQATREGVPTVVAVGALHCFGDHGLPRLLEREGYKVTMHPAGDTGASHE